MLILIVAHDADCEIVKSLDKTDHYVMYHHEDDIYKAIQDFKEPEELARAVRTTSVLCMLFDIPITYQTSTEMAALLAKYDVNLSSAAIKDTEQ